LQVARKIAPCDTAFTLQSRYNFFACHQILPDNLKAMPAEEAIEK
jgi:hypothetical protein